VAQSLAIECQGDLPAKWQQELKLCRAAYVKRFLGKRPLAWAELAAFEDIRKRYLDWMAELKDRPKSPAD